MVPGARSKLGAPMFEPDVFRKQMYFIKESTCDIVRTFPHPLWSFGTPTVIMRPPQWFVAPIVIQRRGIVPPLPPLRYAPATSYKFL